MKKLLLILTVFLISLAGIAQQSAQDVIYLKNGTVVRGKIIDQVPNQSIKVYTTNRSVVEFKMDEVEKMTKEKGRSDFISEPDEWPVSKGNIILGGSGHLDYQKSKTESGLSSSEHSRFYIGLYPLIAYFIADNLALGATTTISLLTGEGSSSYSLGIGPEVRYYFDTGAILKAEVSYIFSHYPSDNEGYFSLKPGIGYAIFINPKVSIEPSLIYEFNSSKWRDSPSKTKNSRIGIEVGFSIFL
jgi:hypothetical protein